MNEAEEKLRSRLDANGVNYFPGAICNGVKSFDRWKNGVVIFLDNQYVIDFGNGVLFHPTSQFEIVFVEME